MSIYNLTIVTEHPVALIQSQIWNHSFIRVGSEYSIMFQTTKEVRKGCILSLEFLTLMENIMGKTIEIRFSY